MSAKVTDQVVVLSAIRLLDDVYSGSHKACKALQ